ncbi:MAG: hypothetical protein M1828_005315 [Chrysothrix sp. TS-e1954]|nr:MAG: hypothetical protein M1828_005315 [Chrysothrix sp. TS-e1954]
MSEKLYDEHGLKSLNMEELLSRLDRLQSERKTKGDRHWEQRPKPERPWWRTHEYDELTRTINLVLAQIRTLKRSSGEEVAHNRRGPDYRTFTGVELDVEESRLVAERDAAEEQFRANLPKGSKAAWSTSEEYKSNKHLLWRVREARRKLASAGQSEVSKRKRVSQRARSPNEGPIQEQLEDLKEALIKIEEVKAKLGNDPRGSSTELRSWQNVAAYARKKLHQLDVNKESFSEKSLMQRQAGFALSMAKAMQTRDPSLGVQWETTRTSSDDALMQERPPAERATAGHDENAGYSTSRKGEQRAVVSPSESLPTIEPPPKGKQRAVDSPSESLPTMEPPRKGKQRAVDLPSESMPTMELAPGYAPATEFAQLLESERDFAVEWDEDDMFRAREASMRQSEFDQQQRSGVGSSRRAETFGTSNTPSSSQAQRRHPATSASGPPRSQPPPAPHNEPQRGRSTALESRAPSRTRGERQPSRSSSQSWSDNLPSRPSSHQSEQRSSSAQSRQDARSQRPGSQTRQSPHERSRSSERDDTNRSSQSSRRQPETSAQTPAMEPRRLYAPPQPPGALSKAQGGGGGGSSMDRKRPKTRSPDKSTSSSEGGKKDKRPETSKKSGQKSSSQTGDTGKKGQSSERKGKKTSRTS